MTIRRSRAAFTLIELMIVVAILGVVVAIAVPTFLSFVKRSKCAEAPVTLKSIFTHASTYFTQERSGLGFVGTASSRCTVGTTTASPAVPTSTKQFFVGDANFTALGFFLRDPVYFSYQATSLDPGCAARPAGTILYNPVAARGDLDADGTLSTFEIQLAVDGEDEMYRSPGIFIVNDLE
jgi:prepilin-type N-terminal cleavage/methylation domain-containing protein